MQATRVVSLPGSSGRTELFVKPGHWTATWLEATADDDFHGTLDAQWVDVVGAPLGYPPMGFRLRAERPAVLPKKQVRGFEQLLFTPNDDDFDGPGVTDSRESKLRDTNGRFRLAGQMKIPAAYEARQRLTALRDHQALFAVVSSRPYEYAFLNTFDALATPHGPNVLPEHDAHYRILFAAEEHRALLPSSMLGWTTTAYLLWDDYDSGRLSDDQRQALVDWVHWGGVLIVAGPGLLDAPLGEPLASLLPAMTSGSAALDAAALSPLLKTARSKDVPSTQKSWSGAQLKLQSTGEVLLGTADAPLIAERRVGRGRVLVTAFRPSQAELVAWHEYGSFANAYLLRRPARSWRPHPTSNRFITSVWSDRPQIYFDDELRGGRIDPWFDPVRVSGLRFTGRGDVAGRTRRQTIDVQPPIGPGTAAWRDDDPLSDTMRGVLRDAAGIFAPPASLVLLLLAAYVTAAVPINWLVFRLLKRTEWAWLATPVLALVFTVIVVRAAELDLGFVRSVSEASVLEIQPGYDRGHLVRNVAIYNSLGTTYDATSGDATFVALPSARSLDPKQTPSDRTVSIVRRTDESGSTSTGLAGFIVDSGSVGFLRAEQMTPLGGVLRAEKIDDRRVRIVNGTRWELRDVRLNGPGNGAIDVLPAGGTVEIRLDDRPSPKGDVAARRGEIDVDAIWRQLQEAEPEESLRLTAWSSTAAPELRIDPLPSQRRGKTVVVAHLEYVRTPAPEMDANLRIEVEQRAAANP